MNEEKKDTTQEKEKDTTPLFNWMDSLNEAALNKDKEVGEIKPQVCDMEDGECLNCGS